MEDFVKPLSNKQFEALKSKLNAILSEYANHRRSNALKGLESPNYAAILTETFADGICAALEMILYEEDRLQLDVEKFCTELDPNYQFNLQQRESKFSDVLFNDKN